MGTVCRRCGDDLRAPPSCARPRLSALDHRSTGPRRAYPPGSARLLVRTGPVSRSAWGPTALYHGMGTRLTAATLPSSSCGRDSSSTRDEETVQSGAEPQRARASLVDVDARVDAEVDPEARRSSAAKGSPGASARAPMGSPPRARSSARPCRCSNYRSTSSDTPSLTGRRCRSP